MAAVRLSRLQRRILAWPWQEEQRTYGSMVASHEDLVRALAHEKGNVSHSLRNLEAKGLICIVRMRGGKAATLDLTAAGRLLFVPPSDVVVKEDHTPNQTEALATLYDQWRGMKQYSRKTPGDIAHMDATARLAVDLYSCDDAVFEACRLRLSDHPLIQGWIRLSLRIGEISGARAFTRYHTMTCEGSQQTHI